MTVDVFRARLLERLRAERDELKTLMFEGAAVPVEKMWEARGKVLAWKRAEEFVKEEFERMFS